MEDEAKHESARQCQRTKAKLTNKVKNMHFAFHTYPQYLLADYNLDSHILSHLVGLFEYAKFKEQCLFL